MSKLIVCWDEVKFLISLSKECKFFRFQYEFSDFPTSTPLKLMFEIRSLEHVFHDLTIGAYFEDFFFLCISIFFIVLD